MKSPASSQSESGQNYPELSVLVAKAGLGDLKGVLDGLALRQDVLVTRKHMRSVLSFQHKSHNPKASVADCEWAGESGAGELPEQSEEFVKGLLDLAREVMRKNGNH